MLVITMKSATDCKIHPVFFVIARFDNILGGIHDQGTTFGTKDLRNRDIWVRLVYFL